MSDEMTPIKTEEINGFTVELYQDPDPLNPRQDWPTLGVMVYGGHRYILGDVKFGEWSDRLAGRVANMASAEAWERWADRQGLVYLPTYAYIHSGVVMNTTGYSCPWDSGQAGWIFTTMARCNEWFGTDWKRWSPNRRAMVQQRLNAEVETYSQYISGDVYGFMVKDSDGEIVDSAWGYYGDPEAEAGAMSEARQVVAKEA